MSVVRFRPWAPINAQGDPFRPQPVLSCIVDQMERDNLVTRRTARRDSRVVEVHLTPRGRKLYAEIAPVAARHAQLTVKSLTSAQQKELLAMLRIIIRNLREAPSIEAEEKAIAQRAR